MYNFEEEIAKVGLDIESYEAACKDIDAKLAGENDLDWAEIRDKYNIQLSSDVIRKANGTVFGGAFRTAYLKETEPKILTPPTTVVDDKLDELRKERIKLQTANIERNRVNRAEARKELYYEYVGQVIQAIEPPKFAPVCDGETKSFIGGISYLVALADVHYGAVFNSVNNAYSPEIAKERFKVLTAYLTKFIQSKKLSEIHVVSLGDLIQGMLRLSDLKLNDTSMVRATVEVCHLIAEMLTELSQYTNVHYYHVPTANHTQVRVLGAKANELNDEDLEHLMGHYIQDLCKGNEHVTVSLAHEGDDFIELHVEGNTILAMHGHQVKDLEDAVKNISTIHHTDYDALIIGHYHNGREIPSYENLTDDAELLVAPSFVGSDPYSTSICKGSKAAVKIYGFDELWGHTETYKIILN